LTEQREEAQPPGPTLTPTPAIFSYPDEAAQRLGLCSEAFHTFFILEQTAFHNPEMVSTDRYQAEAGSAMQAFREACLPLGQMPSAPNAYRDVDRWLKLAAGEVAPAADTFNAVLADEKDAAASLDRALDHMMRFIEYTNRAHDLLRRLDRRKQI
jgi:hypothetical protein